MAAIHVRRVDAIGACFEAESRRQAWRPVSDIDMAGIHGCAAPWPMPPGHRRCRRTTIPSTQLRIPARRAVSARPCATCEARPASPSSGATSSPAQRAPGPAPRRSMPRRCSPHRWGMRFTFSTAAGETLGRRAAQWVAPRHLQRQPRRQGSAGLPAGGVEQAHIHQLARHAVGLGSVVHDATRCGSVVVGVHPSVSRALVRSPSSVPTAVGRK